MRPTFMMIFWFLWHPLVMSRALYTVYAFYASETFVVVVNAYMQRNAKTYFMFYVTTSMLTRPFMMLYFARRSSVGRLSLLSFVSLDDQQTDTAAAHFTGEVLRHEDSRFSALSCSPQKPQRRSFNDTTTVSTKLVGNEAKQHRSPYGLGYASVRVSQRRRRTTLGYALRLQKPK